MMLFPVGLVFLIAVTSSSFFASALHLDVEELKGIADFRSVRLSWKYQSVTPPSFTVKCCELVAWGKDKCATQLVNTSDPSQINSVTYDLDRPSPRTYQTVIDGLRLATGYSFEVQPVLEDGMLEPVARARSLAHNELTLLTKGFSASPRSCLGDRSEVDIETGPFFGGHISVEGAYDKRCTWLGDARDEKSVHTFVIDHQICGGVKKEDRIETIVIVSESRSIITHTARRFMVVCNLVPETYTIRASLHIPGKQEQEEDRTNDAPNEIPEESIGSGMPGEEAYRLTQHPNNRMLSSKHAAELQQVAHLFSNERNETTTAHLVLMVLLVVAAAVGAMGAVWWAITGATRQGHFNLTSVYDEGGSCRGVDDVVPRSSDEKGNVVIVPSRSGLCHSDSFRTVSSGVDNTAATTLVLASSLSDIFRSSEDSNC